ncbi:F-box protein At2g26160-like [Vicia villosa]|uniref:F-box protein At2g26160-like n=1 Tax=Vicia villosa TaxID=3911 RepID=UPI00273CCF7C|nr:F-box protein At2g26160-like [Vicia villosa]
MAMILGLLWTGIVDVNGMIAGFDAGLGQISHIEMTKINFKNDHRNLVLFKEDMLLVIQSRIYDRQAGHLTYETVGFKVYKMNWNERKWEQIQSLGEHSLFIGTKSSLCCCAADFVGCRPNCIYFTYFTDYVNGKDVGIYNLSDKSIEPLPGYLSNSYGHSVWVELTP